MLFYQPEDRNQNWLYNSLEEMVEPTNPVRLLDLFIDKIVHDNPDDFIRYKDSNYGAPAYMASTFLKLYIYGCINSINTSRKLENECKRNIELKWLLGNLQPAYWVISQFRTHHKDMIEKVWKQFRKFLRSHEYIDLKTVAIDGTKLKANAKKEMLTIDGLKRMIASTDKQLEEYLEQLKLNDKSDDILEEYETIADSDNLQKHLIEKIAQLEEKIEKLTNYKAKMELAGLDRLSPTDEEAKLMRSRYGLIPAFNGQFAVDSKHKLIADFLLTDDEADTHQAKPMIESINEAYDELPDEALTDKGYYFPDDIESMEKLGVDMYVSVPSEPKDESGISFKYDAEKQIYVCSEGKELHLVQKNVKKRSSIVDKYQGTGCDGCLLREKCTKAKAENGRTIYRHINQEYRDKYKEKMKTRKSKLKMYLRKCLVEHPFGTIKNWTGKIQLLLRGLEKGSTEVCLWVTSYNWRRLVNIENFDVLKEKIASYCFA